MYNVSFYKAVMISRYIKNPNSVWYHQDQLFFFFLVILGVELTLTVAMQVLSHLSHTARLFLCYFWDKVSLYARLGWIAVILFMLPNVTGIIGMSHGTSHWLKWGLINFLPGLASNCNPLCLYLLPSWDCRLEPLYPAFCVTLHYVYIFLIQGLKKPF
jgi:hypothetical protein